jgi:hypothetical protein
VPKGVAYLESNVEIEPGDIGNQEVGGRYFLKHTSSNEMAGNVKVFPSLHLSAGTSLTRPGGVAAK